MQSTVGINWNLSDGLNYVKRQWENIRFFDEYNNVSNHDAATTTSTTADNNQPFNLISNFESQLIEFQSLLIWEKPANSIFALICFTCFYWMVVLWDPHLLSVIATLAFCYHFYEMWTRYVWPEISVPSAVIKEKWTSINPKVLSAPEIQFLFSRVKIFILELLNKIIEFRAKCHGTFCCFTTLFFACFLYIGHFIPGVLITYCTAIILFLTPGFLAHIVPKNTFDVSIEKHNNSNEKKDHQHQPSVQPPSQPLSALFSPDDEFDSRMTSTSTIKAKESNDDYGDGEDDNVDNDVVVNQLMLTTHENHFRKTPESTSSSDSDSDFVLISESELLNL